jgi:hypothetical protein
VQVWNERFNNNKLLIILQLVYMEIIAGIEVNGGLYEDIGD